ncbi:hypothetical protein [Halococcus sp. AFM35]|uniref:hypothetical protein n=1 Tax=Halococcus sp. AFM35 TaxID=3421653 RepID=UPI003EBF4EAD
MNRTDTIAFTMRFLGAVLFAIGIGAAVVGGYALVQEDLGLCGNPILEVSSSNTYGDDVPSLPANSLSPAEHAAFVEAVTGLTSEAEIDGQIRTNALREGALITYQGERYYAAIGSLNQCVAIDPLVFPLGVALVGLGAVAYVSPTLRRWFESIMES